MKRRPSLLDAAGRPISSEAPPPPIQQPTGRLPFCEGAQVANVRHSAERPEILGWNISLYFRTALAAGKAYALGIRKDAHAREVAATLRHLADALDSAATEAEGANDAEAKGKGHDQPGTGASDRTQPDQPGSIAQH